MRILILGGGVFVGRALTDAALAAGHDVTQLNRGRSAPPDPRVATLQGDRTDAATLRRAGARWDAVIDTSGYLPQAVARSTAALREAARYLFVSSVSAYAGFERAGIDEDAPLAAPPDPLPEAMSPPAYGGLKAACEAVVRAAFDERALVVRPGLIVGPHDPTDRFTYWPVRLARGGRVLAPGRPQRRVQLIDVRDLAEWLLRLLARGATGTFNATGPAAPLTMEALLEACGAGPGDTRLAWVDDEALLGAGVVPWKDLPLWIPESDPAMRGFMEISNARALAAGLVLRPLAETARDTLAWARAARPPGHEWKAGLAPAREEDLLALAGGEKPAPRR
jgi:2'-hydroxyisoflavone reductase